MTGRPGDRDPTEIRLSVDPRERRMRGVATWGNVPFDVPLVSQIEGNLWTGGCQNGLVLPSHIRHLVSLYPWERYEVRHALSTELYVRRYDGSDVDEDRLEPLVLWAEACVQDAPTLIHCQAGLNRSGLIAALVLMRGGRTGREAVELLREKRSPAVLCNPHFDEFLVG